MCYNDITMGFVFKEEIKLVNKIEWNPAFWILNVLLYKDIILNDFLICTMAGWVGLKFQGVDVHTLLLCEISLVLDVV